MRDYDLALKQVDQQCAAEWRAHVATARQTVDTSHRRAELIRRGVLAEEGLTPCPRLDGACLRLGDLVPTDYVYLVCETAYRVCRRLG